MGEISEHFEGKPELSDFVQAKQSFETDRKFLDGIEIKMKEMVSSSGPLKKARADQVQDMLQDIVNLRRSWMALQEDKHMQADLDLASFFQRPGKDDERLVVNPGRDPI